MRVFSISSKTLLKILPAFAVLAFVVVVLGAYVRIRDAGLGCPDWPGCFGQLIGVPDHPGEIAAAKLLYPHQEIHQSKAWLEIIHRYIAGVLVLGALFLVATRKSLPKHHKMPWVILLVIIFQALLGMWTVTLKLSPVVVSLHLLGGMSLLALFTYLWASTRAPIQTVQPIFKLAHRLLALLVIQIALGVWVSSHYAGLSCPDYPSCVNQNWMPDMNFAQGFNLATGLDAPLPALQAMAWTHRWFALFVLFVSLPLMVRLVRSPQPIWGLMLLGLILAQIALGILNVLLRLPVALAAGHTLVAALLLMLLVHVATRGRAVHRHALANAKSDPAQLGAQHSHL